ncbi:MAG: hypothetical protein DWQ31_16565 [Planctomycetota bacterium]|nr:MAG: hypothetical protein DWQ31_16565 [Planctomycetota bacterium]
MALEEVKRGEFNGIPYVIYEDDQGDIERPAGPGLLRKAWNFTKAAAQHVASGAKKVSRRKLKRRLAICRSCPSGLYQVRDKRPPQMKDLEEVGTCLHKTCGCYIHDSLKIFPNKLAWSDQACPEGHWPAEN